MNVVPEPFDAEQFMERLDRINREREQVAALRPSARELASSLDRMCTLLADLIEASRQLACLEMEIQPTTTYRWIPRRGSLAQQDREAFEAIVHGFCVAHSPKESKWLDTNPARNPTDWATAFLERCVRTIIDDLSGVATLIQSPGRIRAPITLARSVLEAASMVCFITDAGASRQERLRRILNFEFEQLKEASNASKGTEYEQTYEAEISTLIQFAQYAGFSPSRYRAHSHLPPSILGEDRRSADSARFIVDLVLPGVGLSMWRSLSAVAHSRDSQTLLPDEYSLVHRIEGWRTSETVAWHAVAPLAVTAELLERLGGYLGWEFEKPAEAFTNVVEQWAAGGGLADKKIRKHLGLEVSE